MLRRPLVFLWCLIALSWAAQVGAQTQNSERTLQNSENTLQNSENTLQHSEHTLQHSEHTLKMAEGAKPPSAKIEDLAWLTGYWQGEGLGGQCEEAWGAPIEDRMFGWFSMRKEGELVFSEAMTVVEVDGGLVMRIKHFDADFVGWESKEDYVSFPLVRLEPQIAYFSGLTFKRVEDRLEIYLVLSSQGERTEHKFEMTRAVW